LLVAVFERRVDLLLSTLLLLEYEAVLSRPENLEPSGLTAHEVIELLDGLAGLCTPVGFDFRWRAVARDPNEDLVVETAVNGVAEAIATFNLRDMAAGAALFGISAVRPAVLLRRIQK